jgi:hypothetical protein
LRFRKERVILRRSCRTSPFSDTVAVPFGEGTDRSVRTLRRRPVGELTLIRTERSRFGGLQLGADGRICSETSVALGSFSAAAYSPNLQVVAACAPDATAPEAAHASKTKMAPLRSASGRRLSIVRKFTDRS